MAMASEQRKVFVEILKGNMPKTHNENAQTWFLCQQFAGLCQEDVLFCETEGWTNCSKVVKKHEGSCYSKCSESQ